MIKKALKKMFKKKAKPKKRARFVHCEACAGRGFEPDGPKCLVCGGKGKVKK